MHFPKRLRVAAPATKAINQTYSIVLDLAVEKGLQNTLRDYDLSGIPAMRRYFKRVFK